tara:strand:+ start:986 stop:1720 length:735 start_codon:yes stop_codon:yes gene_type:complete
MNLLEEKLNLFKKILKEVEEEELKGKQIDMDAQQHVSEPIINRIGKMLAKKLDGQIPDEIEESNLKSELGIIDFGVLKKLSATSIAGIKMNAFNTQGKQEVGAKSLDVRRYENPQVVPFLALNKDGETLSGSKGEEEFYVLFWLPALGINIKSENINLHSEIFDLEPPQKGFTYKHVELYNIPHYKVTEDMIPQIQSFLKNGNLLGVNQMIRKNSGGKMKSTSRSESVGQDFEENNPEDNNLNK